LGSPVAGAALLASAEGVDVGDPAITMVADNNNITEITSATTCQEVPPHLVITTVLAALAATTLEEVVVTESALASFAALPGIIPNITLRKVKLSMSLPRRTSVFKAISSYEWSSHMMLIL
jgi:hypothetical protein